MGRNKIPKITLVEKNIFCLSLVSICNNSFPLHILFLHNLLVLDLELFLNLKACCKAYADTALFAWIKQKQIPIQRRSVQHETASSSSIWHFQSFVNVCPDYSRFCFVFLTYLGIWILTTILKRNAIMKTDAKRTKSAGINIQSTRWCEGNVEQKYLYIINTIVQCFVFYKHLRYLVMVTIVIVVYVTGSRTYILIISVWLIPYQLLKLILKNSCITGNILSKINRSVLQLEGAYFVCLLWIRNRNNDRTIATFVLHVANRVKEKHKKNYYYCCLWSIFGYKAERWQAKLLIKTSFWDSHKGTPEEQMTFPIAKLLWQCLR